MVIRALIFALYSTHTHTETNAVFFLFVCLCLFSWLVGCANDASFVWRRQSFWLLPTQSELITNTSMPFFCDSFITETFTPVFYLSVTIEVVWHKSDGKKQPNGWWSNWSFSHLRSLLFVKLKARRSLRRRQWCVQEIEESAVEVTRPATVRHARKNTHPMSRVVTSARNAAAPTPLIM